MDIERISLEQEKLSIKERGVAKDWFSIPAGQVGNMCVLEALLRQIRGDWDFSPGDQAGVDQAFALAQEKTWG